MRYSTRPDERVSLLQIKQIAMHLDPIRYGTVTFNPQAFSLFDLNAASLMSPSPFSKSRARANLLCELSTLVVGSTLNPITTPLAPALKESPGGRAANERRERTSLEPCTKFESPPELPLWSEMERWLSTMIRTSTGYAACDETVSTIHARDRMKTYCGEDSNLLPYGSCVVERRESSIISYSSSKCNGLNMSFVIDR